MKNKITLEKIIAYGLELKMKELLIPNLTLKLEVSKDERSEIFKQLLNSDIPNEYISSNDNKGYYKFEIFNVKFEIH